MGQWGYYDDQSDRVQDLVISIERGILPVNLSKCETYTKEKIRKNVSKIFFTKENALCTNKIIEYMKFNLEKVSKYIMTKIKYDDRNFIVPGIAVHAAKGWGTTSQFPKSLPKNFPQWLRKEALLYSKKQLAKLCKRNWDQRLSNKVGVVCSDSDYSGGWKDWKGREQALKDQIRLFSVTRRNLPKTNKKLSLNELSTIQNTDNLYIVRDVSSKFSVQKRRDLPANILNKIYESYTIKDVLVSFEKHLVDDTK